jgi:hypothetical protein
MKRRSFVKNSILTTTLAGAMPLARAAKGVVMKNEKQEFYELRVYTLKNAAQQKLIEDYFQNAAIPALNRLGSNHVGVFTEMKPEGQTKVFVIIPYQSIDDFVKVEEKLLKDAAYLQAGSAYLNAPATEPAYERIESSLLRAFEHMPKLEVPPNKQRIFELRRYESASESAGKKKIEMFNNVGEIDIFKKAGLTPVFFGETLIGPLRPNLTYMITFDDMAEHDKNWKTFISDPEWKRISGIPEYADAKIVSHITSTFLVPTSFSQI